MSQDESDRVSDESIILERVFKQLVESKLELISTQNTTQTI